MKIAVNLASHPYIDLRPVYNRLRTWTVILALLGGALWYLYRNESGAARAAREHVATVENHVHTLEQQQQDYRRMMQQPKDASILLQSDFLNSLFARKAFSWTATMTDLETVLPSGVQVLSIDPINGPNGTVIIRLRVTGERDRELELVRNLEKSRHFAAPRLAAESMATVQGAQGMQNVSGGPNLVNFDILADYRPLLLEPGKSAKTADEDARDKAKPSQTAAGKAAHKKATPKKPALKKPGAAEKGRPTP
jgi:type IV pilus assembly protein PilN